ncbi:MAG: MerR family transcriptional regulator [Bacteroidales bacterium]|nr:MerR family transcriptional regulator [Bacteroidales bacterium]
MIRYSIRDLEKITGIKAHTIRIWEKRYGIVAPLRTQTNIRYYSDEDLRRLMNVAILNKYGYKISNIQSMSADELHTCVVDLTHQDIDNDHQVDNLVMAMIELDELRFDKIISSSIIKQGFDYTFENLLYKFLEKIGILWQIGAVNPAQEHFISHLIRQKLILAIDGQQEYRNDPKTFLLFLPENEYHEMALLYLQFLIRKEGHKVIYLGQNVPLLHLKDIFEIHHVDFLVTSVASKLPVERISEILNELVQLYGEREVLIGGKCFFDSTISLPENVRSFDTMSDFYEFLTKV